LRVSWVLSAEKSSVQPPYADAKGAETIEEYGLDECAALDQEMLQWRSGSASSGGSGQFSESAMARSSSAWVIVTNPSYSTARASACMRGRLSDGAMVDK